MVGRVRTISVLAALLIALAVGARPDAARADRYSLNGDIQAFWMMIRVQDSQSLRDRLFGRGGRDEQPAVGVFSSQGGPSFTLDQSGSRPLMRFEGSSEIWVLRPSAGLRGDIYYRNDVGEVMLRATRLGGLTLYTSDAPGGRPCALDSPARPLRVPRHDFRSIVRHLVRESARGTDAVGNLVEITAQDVDDSTDDIFGDAATVSIDGVVRASQSRGGRERLSGLRELRLVLGSSPDVRRSGASLIVTITPRLGPAGRPSSARVARALLS